LSESASIVKGRRELLIASVGRAMDGFVRCLAGTEWIAAAELTAGPGASIERVRHREVRFSVPPGTDDELLDLRTVDDVFATVLVADGIGHTRAELPRLARAALGATVVPDAAPDPTVDVVASFLGRRNFNRFEIEDALGPPLARLAGGHHRSRADGSPHPPADVTFRAHLAGDELIVGRRLGAAPRHRRAYKVSSGPGSLHPPLAAAMVLLAGIEPGLRLLDPFCGAATIPGEAVRWEPTTRATGLDASAAVIADAVANTGSLDGVALVRGDAARLPVRSSTVDRLVTNPPWGGQAPFLAAAGPDTVADLVAGALRSVVLVDEELDDRIRWPSAPSLTVITAVFGRHPRLHVFHPGPDPLPPGGRWSAELQAAYDTWT
jgi:hypothetical protein